MELPDAELADVARQLRTGELRPDAYVDRLRERFEELEPSIEAFLDEEDRWSRVKAELERLEERYPDPESRPPLYGVPIGVKDIFHAAGYPTKAGSNLPPEALTGPEARTVTLLKEAGAVVLGKTVTTEFAYFKTGPTRNPHDTDHSPGGSSSGSAAAVAAGLCPLALGTQTIGSVNRPAAFCGTVGVKPSFGRTSIEGVIPVSPAVDTVGYFTQDLAGARLAADVLYEDWRAEETAPGTPTIGAVEGPYLQQASETGRQHFRDHLEALEDAGFDVERVDPFPDIEAVNERHDVLVAAETALSHNEWYPKYVDEYHEKTVELIEQGLPVDCEELGNARAGRKELRKTVHETMDEHDVDVVVSPAAPGPAPEGIDTSGDPIMNLPWTHAGVPSVTLPASKTDDGLPIGLQCVTRYGYDEWLLSWCQSIDPVFDYE